MKKPIALDLFSGAGGAAIGLKRAGFYVIGVDIKKPSNYYGDEFINADIHNLPFKDLSWADFVWASPPCQRFSIGTQSSKNKDLVKSYPDFIPATRKLLSGHAWTCIENVPRAPLMPNLTLNGSSVGLNWIERRRVFEMSFWVAQVVLSKAKGIRFTIAKRRSATNEADRKRRKAMGLPKTIPKDVAKVFMGIPQKYHMTDSEIGEAVPPPYSEFIAREAIRQMRISE